MIRMRTTVVLGHLLEIVRYLKVIEFEKYRLV